MVSKLRIIWKQTVVATAGGVDLAKAAATISVNLSGFGSGNAFVNGEHIGYYNLAAGNCSK